MKKTFRGRSSAKSSFKTKKKNPLFIALGFYFVLAIMLFKGSIGCMLFVWYIFVGLATYLMYAKDKHAAQTGSWRTPEVTLHILSLIGGWVGAMLAQHQLRHKTQKSDFRLVYYLTVIANLAGLLFLITGGDISAHAL